MCNRNRRIASILKSYGVNQQIINDIGYRLSKPIMVVADEANINWITKSIVNFERVYMGESVNKKEAAKILSETYSEFVIVPYPMTRKGRELLDDIIIIMKSGIGSNGHTNAPTLIFAERTVRRKDIENYYMVYFEGDLDEVPVVSMEEVVPTDEQVEVVLDKISELDMHGKTQTEKALLAACCFLYPNLKEHGQMDEYEELFNCVQTLARQNEEGNFIADLGKTFIMEIYKWQETTRFHNVFELPDIEMSVVDCIDEVFLFDDDYFYMKESLFMNISSSLLKIFPSEVLKSALVDEGILRPENEKAYTVKANYYNITGGYERIRMLRFKRSVLKKCGETDLIELCLETGRTLHMVIKVGRDRNNKEVYFDPKKAINKSIAIMGASGTGKSVEEQKIALEIVSKGGTALMLDYHHVLSDEDIPEEYKRQFNSYLHEIDAYKTGITCNLFQPMTYRDGTQEHSVDAICAVIDVFDRTMKLGFAKKTALRTAVTQIVEEGLYEKEGFRAIDQILKDMNTSVAEELREKLYSLTVHNIFRSGDFFIQEGKINVIRLSQFDVDMQETTAEIILAYIWRLAVTEYFKEKELYLFLDEFQNLPSGKRSSLVQMLTEGRKFGVNLVLATQQLPESSSSEVQKLLTQCGLTLYFRPSKSQISIAAKMIDPRNKGDWMQLLQGLKRGEFVASGALMRSGRQIDIPLKLSSYER